MKKAIIILLCVLLSLCFVLFNAKTNVSALGNASKISIDKGDIKEILNDFVGKFEDRTSGSEGEHNAAEYIAEKFKSFGLTAYKGDDFLLEFKYTADNKEAKSYNVAAELLSTNQSNKWVYIGAHYDNYYGILYANGDPIKSHGAYDNGTGVATMLAIVKTIYDNGLQFDFNIAFVAFGSGENGNLGSGEFVKDLSVTQVDNSLIMFNLDSIGAGDNLYLYTTEVKNKHEDFIFGVAAENNIIVSAPPSNKNVLIGEVYFNDYGYSHFGMKSDNFNFHNAGILTANLLSFNWELSKYKIVQSKDKPTFIHTFRDTLYNLNKDYPDYASQCAKAGDIILNTMTETGFEATMLQSKDTMPNVSFWNNSTWAFLLAIGIFGVFAGGLAGLGVYYKKRAAKNGDTLRVNVTTQGPMRQTPPTAENVFGYGENNDKDDFNGTSAGDGQSGSSGGSIFGDEFE